MALLCHWQDASEKIVMEDERGVDLEPETWTARFLKSESAGVIDPSINAHTVTKKAKSAVEAYGCARRIHIIILSHGFPQPSEQRVVPLLHVPG